MKKLLMLIAVAMFLIIGTFGVLGAAPAEYKELKIGVSVSMTGPGAGWGMPTLQGIVMHVEEINAAGGLTIGGEKYKINLCTEDSKYEVAASITAMEKLVYRDKVHVMYTFGGAPVLATQERLEKMHMLNFILSWGAEQRTPQYPYTYSVGMTAADFAQELFEWVKKNYQVKTLIYLAENVQSGWQAEPPAIKAAEATGFKLLKSEFYETGTTDFYPLIARLSKADAVLFQVHPMTTGLILKQREQLGAKFFGFSWSMNPDELLKIAGEAAEKNYVFRHTDFTITPSGKAFEERYRKRWRGESPNFNSQEGYDFVGIYAQAVQKAGKLDSDAVKAVLDDPAFVYKDGLLGPMRWGGKSLYGRNCDMYYPISVGRLKDGKAETVGVIPVTPK